MKSLKVKNTAAKVGGVACALAGSGIAFTSAGIAIVCAGLSAGVSYVLDGAVSVSSKLVDFGIELTEKEFED